MRTLEGRQRLTAALAALALLAGCEGEPERAAQAPERPEASAPPPPPDAGTSAGHGADPARVEVPDAPLDPPSATIALGGEGRTLARASQPGGGHTEVVALRRPRLRGTTLGLDANEGVARVRVSVSEVIECSGGFSRRRIRYFPPPQIERIRSRPGAGLPTRSVRSLEIELGGGRCARPAAVRGELWGEAINGSGLEAVTPHIRFSYTY